MIEKKDHKYANLKIWQMGIELVKDIYRVSNTFPQTETYTLYSQMQRSAISIPSNIAEGSRRLHSNDFRRFLTISLGSIAELETQITIANELKYINKETKDNLFEKTDHLSRMIYNFHRNL